MGCTASPTGSSFLSLLSLSGTPWLQSEAQAPPVPPIWASYGAMFWEKGLELTDRGSTSALSALGSRAMARSHCTASQWPALITSKAGR